MPELPEVETVVRALRARLPGRRIRQAEFLAPLTLRHAQPGIESKLSGRSIERVERHGKFIAIHLDRGVLTIHLGMTGKLLFDGERTTHTRAVFQLDKGALVFNDSRMFGSVQWDPELPQRVSRLGPEPLEIAPAEFVERLRRHSAPLKNLLLNQRFLRGVGNIYADESLFLAGIHPQTIARDLRKPRALRLHAAIVRILSEAIEHGGSSISDYVDADGKKGWFQVRHQVYGREGETCFRCGSKIRKIVMAQRSTHFCPRCQR